MATLGWVEKRICQSPRSEATPEGRALENPCHKAWILEVASFYTNSEKPKMQIQFLTKSKNSMTHQTPTNCSLVILN